LTQGLFNVTLDYSSVSSEAYNFNFPKIIYTGFKYMDLNELQSLHIRELTELAQKLKI